MYILQHTLTKYKGRSLAPLYVSDGHKGTTTMVKDKAEKFPSIKSAEFWLENYSLHPDWEIVPL